MKKFYEDLAKPILVLGFSQALLSLVYWLILVNMVGLSFSYLQVYGVLVIVNMAFNSIANKFK